MSGPSFRFSLERVRALREQTEDAAREDLAGALQSQRLSEEAMQEAAQTVLRARDAQTQATTAPVEGAELLARQAYLERSERAHRATLDDLGRSEQQVSDKRNRLVQASRDRQALERLKERRRSDHALEQARLESNALDEIALATYRRREAA